MIQRYAEETAATPGDALELEVAELYRQHGGELFNYAAMILRRQDGASDAVQEAFLRYFAQRKCGGAIENPRAWLYRVLYNYLMDRLNRAALKREISSEETADFMDAAHNPEERVSRSQAAREIAAQCTNRELDCLRLRAEGLSYEEVAGALGVRSGTVGALLTRVHKKLRESSGDCRSTRMSIAGALCTLLEEGGAYSP